MATQTWIKPGLWGVVIGGIAVVIVGFGAGLIVSSGSAKTMADARAEKAVLAALTPICVAQFKIAAVKPAGQETAGEPEGLLLAALKKEDSWKRGDFVKKQGWATMPGSTAANGEVASACATELMKIAEKMASK